jgi:hypothetical protein
MVFPDSDYASSSLVEQGKNIVFTHTAFGADRFRYSWNFCQNWPIWQNWEDTTSVPKSLFQDLPPNSAAPNYVNMSIPAKSFIARTLVIDDAALTWSLRPHGSSGIGAIMYSLLLSIPIITGTFAVLVFMWSKTVNKTRQGSACSV